MRKILNNRNWKYAKDHENINLRWHPTDHNFKYEKMNDSYASKMLFNHF